MKGFLPRNERNDGLITKKSEKEYAKKRRNILIHRLIVEDREIVREDEETMLKCFTETEIDKYLSSTR